ncbi:DNA helicase-2 / ATP-dependent DNA helicase PcrA [Micrococcales bacterium KH10]|nr:DNA helicase-2 / ATP-dependent DNA helicase PcrA [Micrococcales bacterium KH10]
MTEITWGAIDIARALRLPEPTAEQVRVIEAPLEPVIVVAGAGSGKTETMAARVVWLIANQIVQPHEVLGLTFTRKAAAELAERIDRRLAGLRVVTGTDVAAELIDRPTVSTYNSYASSLVAEHGLRIGIEPDSQLLTDAGSWQLAAQLVESWPEDLNTTKRVGTVIAAVVSLDAALTEHLNDIEQVRTWMTETVAGLQELPYGPRRKKMSAKVTDVIESLELRRRLLDIVEQLRERKRQLGMLSFGDQMYSAAKLAMSSPLVSEIERQRFATVLLDEYQDTSFAQTSMLSHLFGDGHPVMAVGDPHQSIYAWRGASASSLVRFPSQFARSDDKPAQVLSLSTSWRNDEHILAIANTVATPLRDELTTIDVPRLQARPGAGTGAVTWHWADTVGAEAEAIAAFIERHWGADPSGSDIGRGQPDRQNRRDEQKRPSAAVLCRTRKYFPAIQDALLTRGIPVEIVGLGGLLDVPEVADVLALVQVAHDPSRGECLFRLLTGALFNMSPADVAALRRLARHLDERALRRGSVETSPTPVHFVRHSLADSIDWLVDEKRVPEFIDISAEGVRRLRRLGQTLRELRSNLGLPIPDVLAYAERLLDLDIEAPLAYGTAAGKIHLDALRKVASGFVSMAVTSTVGAFLAWIDAAKVEERGLDRPVAEPDPNAVQLITVHAAKGLEWDVVAAAGLVTGNFPSVQYSQGRPRSSGWLSGDGSLPYPLRGDREDLERIHFDVGDAAEVEKRIEDFRERVGAQAVLEERRLAYVAVTRARKELLVTGARWSDERKTPSQPSAFLTEIAEDEHTTRNQGSLELGTGSEINPAAGQEVIGWWPRANEKEGEDTSGNGQAILASTVLQYLGDDDRKIDTPKLDRARGSIGRAEQEVAGLNSAGQLWALAELLLREQDAQRLRRSDDVRLPSHMSASTMVQFTADRKQVMDDWLRPVPRRPSPEARRGTAVHSWIENFYRMPAALDLDESDIYEDNDFVTDLSALQDAFLNSPWAELTPIAMEEPVDVVLGDVTVRTRIDAIFADPENEGHHIVVDWKSGREPTDAVQQEARKVQLAIYRLAWSRLTGKPIEEIHAAFCYLADGRTVRHDDLPDASALEEILTAPGSAH